MDPNNSDIAPQSFEHLPSEVAVNAILHCVKFRIPFKLPSVLGKEEWLVTKEELQGDLGLVVKKMHKHSDLWIINGHMFDQKCLDDNVKCMKEREKRSKQPRELDDQSQSYVTVYNASFPDTKK